MVLPYKEEVTGSNPVAPTRVFHKSLHIYMQLKRTLNAHFVEKEIERTKKEERSYTTNFNYDEITLSL